MNKPKIIGLLISMALGITIIALNDVGYLSSFIIGFMFGYGGMAIAEDIVELIY